MAKHKVLCWIVNVLVLVGGLNWGLVGLGMLMGRPLNLVNMLFGSLPTVEAVVYLVVGLAALAFGWLIFTAQNCGCQTMDKK